MRRAVFIVAVSNSLWDQSHPSRANFSTVPFDSFTLPPGPAQIRASLGITCLWLLLCHVQPEGVRMRVQHEIVLNCLDNIHCGGQFRPGATQTRRIDVCNDASASPQIHMSI